MANIHTDDGYTIKYINGLLITSCCDWETWQDMKGSKLTIEGHLKSLRYYLLSQPYQ